MATASKSLGQGLADQVDDAWGGKGQITVARKNNPENKRLWNGAFYNGFTSRLCAGE